MPADPTAGALPHRPAPSFGSVIGSVPVLLAAWWVRRRSKT
jgi:hypothetical protein